MKRFLVLPLLLLGFLYASAAGANQSELDSFGTGSITVEPNEAYVTIVADTIEGTAARALKKNNDTMVDVLKSLEEFGVTSKNLATASFTVADHYEQSTVVPGRDYKPVKVGVQVVNTVRVTVCDLASFGKVLDAAVSSGASRIESVSFGSSKSSDFYQKQAPDLAIKDANEKAAEIAKGFGMAVAEPIQINETPTNGTRGMRAYSEFMSAPAGNVPISGGLLTYAVNIHVKWRLVKPVK